MSNSQSPQARRGSAQDYTKFNDDKVQMPTTKFDENADAWDENYNKPYEPEYDVPIRRKNP